MKKRLFNLTEFIVRNIKGLQYLVADVRGLENIRFCGKNLIPFLQKNALGLFYFIQEIKLFMVGQLFVVHTYKLQK